MCKLVELDLDNEKAWVHGIAARAALFKEKLPIAMNNLATAQAKDRLRYAYT